MQNTTDLSCIPDPGHFISLPKLGIDYCIKNIPSPHSYLRNAIAIIIPQSGLRASISLNNSIIKSGQDCRCCWSFCSPNFGTLRAPASHPKSRQPNISGRTAYPSVCTISLIMCFDRQAAAALSRGAHRRYFG